MGFFSVLGNIGKVLAAPVLGGITSAVNANQMRKENARNREWQEKMSDIAYQRQRDLTMESPALQKQGLEMAGISPAAMNGYTGGTAQVSTGTPAPTSLPETFNFDPASLLAGPQIEQMIASADKTKADAKLANEQAEAQKLANNKERNYQQSWMDATTENYIVDDKGNKLFASSPEFSKYVEDYFNTHGVLPDMQSKAGFLSEEAARVQASLAKFDADIHTSNMYKVQSDLAKRVAQLKLADSSVMHAIYKLDKANYDLLLKQIQKVGSDISVNATIQQLNKANTAKAQQDILESVARTALIGTQEKAIKNSSVNNLIDSLDSKKSFAENAATIGKIILSMIAGFSNVKL